MRALIGMGSNIEPELHLKQAAAEIRERYPKVTFSSVYQSAAIGMDGDDFLNACCLLDGADDETELRAWMKSLEDAHGRDRSEGSWKPRTLDLDLIVYEGDVRDDDLYRYAHVYVPATELLGELPGGDSGQRPEAASDVQALLKRELYL